MNEFDSVTAWADATGKLTPEALVWITLLLAKFAEYEAQIADLEARLAVLE